MRVPVRRFVLAGFVGVVCPGGWAGVALTPNQMYVDRVFTDLLGRPADAGALSTYSSLLDAHTLSRMDFVASVTTSPEFLSDQVRTFYQQLLHRPADASGAALGLSLLQSPGGTFEQLQSSLAGTVEYLDLNGGTDASFVVAAFKDFLGRAPSGGELSVFESFLAGGTTRADVAGVILGSTEYRTDLISGYYAGFLHRPADPAGLSAFVTALGSGNKDQFVIDSILASDEYFADALPEPTSLLVGVLPALMLRRRAR